MKKLTKISQFKKGDKIQGFFLCTEKNIKQTKSGDLFLDVELRDITGNINGKIWENVSVFNEKFNSGNAVAVSGFVDSYLDRIYLNIKKINKATIQYYGRYGFDPADIVPSSKKDPKKMWGYIEGIIKNIKNKKLQKLIAIIYRKHKKKLLIHPGSIKLNHNYRSGLLEHIFNMTNIAKKIHHSYKIDTDLVLSGVLLIRIGVLEEISSGYEFEKTKKGNLIGVGPIGIEIIIDAARRIRNFPNQLLTKLEHIILANEKFDKIGDNIKPAFPEALIVQLIMTMDSKMNLMETILDNDQNVGDFTNKNNHFCIPILKNHDSK